MKILILEDNVRLLKVMKTALQSENYKVDCFEDGDLALQALENGYSCFILDINVPTLDGISVLEYIRYNHEDTPVIIISSNHDLEKIKLSYEKGCDDYLKKPFYIFELLEKVKKLCLVKKQCISFEKDCKYDFKNKILYYSDDEVEITNKEILFLELFSSSPHHIASYSEIEEYVWEGEITTNVNIRSLIKRLRKKLPKNSISLVKEVGYCLNKDVKLQ